MMRVAPFLVLLLACSSPPADVDEIPVVASGQVGLVRQVSWPAGGSELTVKLVDSDGGALAEDRASLFNLDFSGGAAHPFDVSQVALPVGFTALLIEPASTQSERLQQIEELKAFVRERPAEESIGLFIWRQDVEQLASFTTKRERLDRQIERLENSTPAAQPLAAEQAFLAAENRVLSIEGRAPRGMRAVVVVGTPLVEFRPSAVAVIQGLPEASARIDAFASTSYYRVRTCTGATGASGELMVQGMEGVLPLTLAPALPESAGGACDISKMGAGLRSYAEKIELVFSAAQREVYDQRAASLSKADFNLSVRLDDSAPVTATAHLRGKGTLGCERKSYTLRLDGPGRHLLPNSRTDEFYLLSMCADDRYVQQYTANQLMKELGLFPLQFRYLELLLDGETQGVYLLLEKAREELVRDSTGVHSVMRRRFNPNPPEDYFESKFDSGAFDAAGLYAAAAADMNLLSEQIDLEQYLRFLALMTAYQNGDYIDEIWVTATEQGLGEGQGGLWFQTMAWDNDDLFSECHYAGNHAFADPFELVYCAEASIDHYLLADANVYGRYVDVLEELLLTQLPPERFDAAANATEAAIMPILSRPGLSAALVRLVADNPGAVVPEEAQRDVAAKLVLLKAQYRERHALLLQRIAAYRAGGAQ